MTDGLGSYTSKEENAMDSPYTVDAQGLRRIAEAFVAEADLGDHPLIQSEEACLPKAGQKGISMSITRAAPA